MPTFLSADEEPPEGAPDRFLDLWRAAGGLLTEREAVVALHYTPYPGGDGTPGSRNV